METLDLDLDLNNVAFLEEIESHCRKNPALIKHFEEELGFSLLVMFIQRGELEFAEWLVDNGAEVNVVVDGTPLGTACYYGNAKLIKKIWQKCNDDFRKKSNPIEMAIYSTKTTNVDALLKLGYSLSTPDNYGSTGIHYAISSIETLDFEDKKEETRIKRQFKMLDYVVSKGVNLDESTRKSIEYLNELNNVDTNRNIIGMCTYFIKTEKNNQPFIDLMRWLLENNIDAHNTYVETDTQRNVSYELPIHCDITELPSLEPLKILLKFTQPDKFKGRVQYNSLKKISSETSFRMMLEAGFNPNAHTDKDTILLYKIRAGLYLDASTLIEFGADIEANDSYKRDALVTFLAFANNNHEYKGALTLLEAILKRKSDFLNYDFKEIIRYPDESKIKDIFDLAVERRLYHWFEKFTQYLNNDEEWIFSEKRLYAMMHEDERPTDIFWKNE